jgi:type IV pilus assembly protein PilA
MFGGPARLALAARHNITVMDKQKGCARPGFPRRARAGFSLVELLIVIAIILIILTFALPRFNVAQENAHEVAVIQAIRTLHSAQTQYMSQFGTFATTLAQLGPPASGGPSATAADLIPTSLANGDKDGYTFTLTATPTGYTINANPKVYNSTGRRTFFSDQNMTIRQHWGQEPATATSDELK